MTNDELIAKFNPRNVAGLKALTQDDLAYMFKLTDDQINVLADAYPNDAAGGRAYLLLWDDKVADNKQLFAPSTWQNLRNVRKYSNQKNLRPYSFMAIQQGTKAAPGQGKPGKPLPRKQQLVDVSATDAAKELKEAISNRTKTATGGIQQKALTSVPVTGQKPTKPAQGAQSKVPAAKPSQPAKATTTEKTSTSDAKSGGGDPSEEFTDGSGGQE